MRRGLSLVSSSLPGFLSRRYAHTESCVVEEYCETGPLVLLNYRIRRMKGAILRCEEFKALAVECGVTDPTKALVSFQDAGVVANLGDIIHTKPASLINLVAASDCEPSVTPLQIVDDAKKKLAKLKAEEEKLRSQLEDAVKKAAKWRKSVWGSAMLFSGSQLAIISRLTYFDLDWDTMEPISYFLGTGTSLCFYMYLLAHRREHSYQDFDNTYLPRKVKKFAPADFDWSHYEALCEEIVAAEADVKKAKDFSKNR